MTSKEYKEIEEVFNKHMTPLASKIIYGYKTNRYAFAINEEVITKKITSGYYQDKKISFDQFSLGNYFYGPNINCIGLMPENIFGDGYVVIKFHIIKTIRNGNEKEDEVTTELNHIYPLEKPVFAMILIKNNGEAFEWFEGSVNKIVDVKKTFDELNEKAMKILDNSEYSENIYNYFDYRSNSLLKRSIIEHLFWQVCMPTSMNGNIIHSRNSTLNILSGVVYYADSIKNESKYQIIPISSDVKEVMDFISGYSMTIPMVKQNTIYKIAFCNIKNNITIIRFYSCMDSVMQIETMRVIVDKNFLIYLFVKTVDGRWAITNTEKLSHINFTHDLKFDEKDFQDNKLMKNTLRSIQVFNEKDRTQKLIEYLMAIKEI